MKPRYFRRVSKPCKLVPGAPEDDQMVRLDDDGSVWLWMWPCSQWQLFPFPHEHFIALEQDGVYYAIEEAEALATIEQWEAPYQKQTA